MATIKVMLLVPNLRWIDNDTNALWHFIPYNLCLLAAMIEDECEVKIVDSYRQDLSPEEFSQILKEQKPDVLGVTVMMDQYLDAGFIAAETAKKSLPGCKVLMGGVSVTTNPEKTAKNPFVDFAVIGEGEFVIKELVLYFQGLGELPTKGICFENNGEIENRGHSDFIDNLDGLPDPAYHLIEFNEYANSAHRRSVDAPPAFPYGRILTSRGCPYDCVFCQVEKISGRKFRARSAEKVLAEIRMLKDEYGIKSIIFDDDNLLTSRKRAVAIFEGMVEQGLALPWVAIATAAFKLDPELIKLMRASGCVYIDVAIESGSERVLKEVVNKPLDLDYAREMVKVARSEGIYVAANFILGFPTETWDEIRQSIYVAEEINADYIKMFAAIPLPGTRLWDLCEQENAFKDGFDKDQSIWASGKIETDDFKANDLTILRAYEWDRINFTDPDKRKRTAEIMGISEKELYDIRRKTVENACLIVADSLNDN